jgi:hypothetical protein
MTGKNLTDHPYLAKYQTTPVRAAISTQIDQKI